MSASVAALLTLAVFVLFAIFILTTKTAVVQKEIEPQTLSEHVDRDMDRAALEVSFPELPWITENHVAAGYCSEEEIGAAEIRAAAFREWVEKNTVGAWRNALLKWVRHSEESYRKAREELLSGAKRSQRRALSDRLDADRNRALELANRMPKPPRSA